MKFYIQVNQDNIITDAIEYPYSNYVEYETNYPLPIGIMGGWFKLENGVVVEYPELKPKQDNDGLEALKELQVEVELDMDYRLSMLELGL